MRSAALLILLVATPLAACEDDTEPGFNAGGGSGFAPGGGGGGGGRRVDARPTVDGGQDASDGAPGAPDADVSDSGPEAADAAPDGAPDAAAAVCQNDQECVLAVRLDRCDPCPVAAHVDAVLAERCLEVYVEGATLGAYAPADCWAGCGEAVGQACFEGPAAAVCDPPRSAGRCTLIR